MRGRRCRADGVCVAELLLASDATKCAETLPVLLLQPQMPDCHSTGTVRRRSLMEVGEVSGVARRS